MKVNYGEMHRPSNALYLCHDCPPNIGYNHTNTNKMSSFLPNSVSL